MTTVGQKLTDAIKREPRELLRMFWHVASDVEIRPDAVFAAVRHDTTHRAALVFFFTVALFYDTLMRTLLWDQKLPNLEFGCFLQRDDCSAEIGGKNYCTETETVVPSDDGDGYSYFVYFAPSLAFVLFMFAYLAWGAIVSVRTMGAVTGKTSGNSKPGAVPPIVYIRALSPFAGVFMCGLSYFFSLLRNSDFIDWDWSLLMIPALTALAGSMVVSFVHLLLVMNNFTTLYASYTAKSSSTAAPTAVYSG
jgi:hypothetical protein